MGKWRTAGIIIGSILLCVAAQGQEEYRFLPDSGREILMGVLDRCIKCAPVATLAEARRSPEEWTSYFAEREGPGGLDGRQVKELTTYLAINFPISLRDIPARAKMVDFLPKGGKQLLLENCAHCHSLSIPALAEKTDIAWGNHLTQKDHAAILGRLKESELNTLTSYLAINMPVPEKEIPEELREPRPWAH